MKFCLTLFLFFSTVAFAAQDSVSKITLDNGLTVLVQEMPSSPVVSIYAAVKAGSATEGEYLGMGISHFVEHMLFKGTAKRPVGAIAKEVKGLGGVINASTGLDYTMYTLDLPKEYFGQGLDIVADMLMNSSFDANEMEKERKVIYGEMGLYKDQPARILSDMVFASAYRKHPYHHPIIGYPVLFDAITHQQLYNYYKRYYIPNNIVLSIAGPVKTEEIMLLIKKMFKDFKPAAYTHRNLAEDVPQTLERYSEQYYSTSVIYFSLAYQGVSVTDPDLYALDVLSMALGQGSSSRLYRQAYINKHLVDGISCSNFTPQDPGMFEIEGSMSADHVDELKRLVQDIIADIQKRGLSSDEFEKTKHQVLAGFVFSNQTSSSLAEKAALDETMTADANFSRHYVDLIKQVSNEDIKRVANRYLQTSRLSVTVLKPKSMEPIAPAAQTASLDAGIQKIILDNGVTVLLHEDHEVRVGSVQLFMNGGMRAEEEPLEGLAHLTGAVWLKATTHLSENKLAQVLEQKGIKLSGGGGHNTMQVSIDFLSEDTGFVLSLLEDIVKNPAMTQEAIDRQRKDALVGIKSRNDDIMDFSFRALIETLYLTHPMRKDVLGTPESLAKITRADVLRFSKSLVYGPNMVISVFGNYGSARVLEEIKKKFGSLPSGHVQIKTFEEAPAQQTRTKDIHMDKEQALLLIAFQAPVLKDKDRSGMEVLNAILGAGLSGRLFVKIRDDNGQSYTTSSAYNPDFDNGSFILYVLTKIEKIDSVKHIILQELEDLKIHDVSFQELADAKSYLKGGFKRSLLTNGALAYTTARDELYGFGYDFYQHYDKEIDAVTVADIRRIAQQYLDINKAAIVTTTPKHE